MTDQTARGAGSRIAAHGVLVRVARDRAYADRALDAVLKRSRLAERDRALATELVYGTLRQQIHLDFLIGQLASRKLNKLAPGVLAALRLGAYQILHTRVPPRAAVFESVALARARNKHAAGFVNAILRKLAALRDTGELPQVNERIADAVEALATEGSHPLWLLRELNATLGSAELRHFVEANNARPAMALRINTRRARREDVAAALRGAGVQVTVPEQFVDGLLIDGGRVRELPGFAAGHFTVQDLAAQLVARLVAPAPEAFVLDVCAAPGGKATHLAELMDNRGKVLAVDIHRARARLIEEQAQRLGDGSVEVAVLDASDPDALDDLLHEHGRKHADAVLIDAPCTGMGTLRRNPELRGLSIEAVGLLAQAQRRLLDASAGKVAPGGVLVYAVCTPTAAEGVEQIASMLRRHPEFVVEGPADVSLQPFVAVSEVGPIIRTWPHRHGADGFFAVRLRRRP